MAEEKIASELDKELDEAKKAEDQPKIDEIHDAMADLDDEEAEDEKAEEKSDSEEASDAENSKDTDGDGKKEDTK